MDAKPINVTRSSLPPYEEYCAEIRELWDSRWLTNMGVKHQRLEQELKNYLDAPQLTLFTNGHLALEGILQAFHFPAGREVITTPFTFASTTHAIVRNGLTPVFCDIDPITYTLNPARIEALVTEKTVAIVPVHVYGTLCDVEGIQSIANKYSLKVIYDAAHAFGEKLNGISVSHFGDASIFSFHATKVFHTIEGGAVSYHDVALTQELNDLKNFGIRSEEKVALPGGNAKMSEFQAAMGICNLRHLEEEIEKRSAVETRYRERLSGVKGIRLSVIQSGVMSNHAYFPVVFDGYQYTRDQVYEMLKKNNIHARKYFYPLTSEFDCYKNFPAARKSNVPNAKYIADRVLCLPIYADLEKEDVDRICDFVIMNA